MKCFTFSSAVSSLGGCCMSGEQILQIRYPELTANKQGRNADACRVAAKPPAAFEACRVPTPETTFPNMLMTTGTALTDATTP